MTRELKLSVADEHGFLTTDGVDFEFEILDGNGGYTASVSETDWDPDAIVTIEGNKVLVNILVGNQYGPTITITDSKKQEASLCIISTDKSLFIPGYGLYLDEGTTYTMNIEFEAGAPYTIEKTRGNAATAVMENNKVKVTSLGLGDTYYKIRDKRGSVAKFTAQTSLAFDMDLANNYLEFDGVNNLTASVKLQWGTEWEVVGWTDKILEKVSVGKVLIATNVWSDYYVLFINTVDEGKGTDTITLKNKEGDLAAVKVNVK
ncbi:MAG: hypothetical protein LUE99_09815 [Bacteroides sp.]|nr:hypothetical protein [Bacteroides sp.]